MVRARADEGQTQGEIDRPLGLQHLDGDQPLIVVQGHHQIEFPLGGPMKEAIRGEGPEESRRGSPRPHAGFRVPLAPLQFQARVTRGGSDRHGL